MEGEYIDDTFLAGAFVCRPVIHKENYMLSNAASRLEVV